MKLVIVVIVVISQCTVGLYVSLCLMIFLCPFLHCKALRTVMYKRYINSIIIIIIIIIIINNRKLGSAGGQRSKVKMRLLHPCTLRNFHVIVGQNTRDQNTSDRRSKCS